MIMMSNFTSLLLKSQLELQVSKTIDEQSGTEWNKNNSYLFDINSSGIMTFRSKIVCNQQVEGNFRKPTHFIFQVQDGNATSQGRELCTTLLSILHKKLLFSSSADQQVADTYINLTLLWQLAYSYIRTANNIFAYWSHKFLSKSNPHAKITHT